MGFLQDLCMLGIVSVSLALHITESGYAYSLCMSRVAITTKTRSPRSVPINKYGGLRFVCLHPHGQVMPNHVYDQIKLSCLSASGAIASNS